MPKLLDARHEAFARARAEGLSIRAAAGRTGYSHGGNTSRIDKLPAVVGRVAELTTQIRRCDEARLEPVIDRLMGLAETAGELRSAAALNAARGLLADAAKLRQQLDAQSFPTADDYDDIPPSVSEEEWIKKYATPE
jgi:hypothetical protein